MANNRIFWAVQAAGISGDGSTSYTVIHGLQSLGITTSFNLEQVFEIGQISIYENIEDIPEVEVTLEKVLDGYPLMYHLSTKDATSGTLTGRSNAKCGVAVSIFADVQNAASGTPDAEVNMSGMFISSVSYNIPTEGSATESVTLVGNHKLWKSTSFTFQGTLFDNQDIPLAVTSGLGGVQRRENVLFTDLTGTLLPQGNGGGIPGISSSGTNNKNSAGVFNTHIGNLSVSADLGRDALNELGRKSPYFRFVNFPVEITTDIEVISSSGDWISGTEEGVASDGDNLSAQQITIAMEDSTVINLGNSNKLSNVTYGGADAGGGNASVTYTYSTFNDFDITHDQDPTAI